MGHRPFVVLMGHRCSRNTVAIVNSQQRAYWGEQSPGRIIDRAELLEHLAGIYAERGNMALAQLRIGQAAQLRMLT